MKNRLLSNKKSKISIFNIFVFVALLAYSIMLLGLLYWAVETSFKHYRDFAKNPIGLPKEFFNNYDGIFETFSHRVSFSDGSQETVNFGGMVVNSILYAVGCAFLTTLATYIVAYCCARYKYISSKIIYAVVVAFMVTPVVGTTASSIMVAKNLGIFGTMHGIWMMNASFLGMYFLVFYEVFRGVPEPFYEAARVDGAHDIQLLTRITVPITISSFSTVFLVNFVRYWNDYQTPLLYIKTKPVLAYGLFLITTRTNIKIPEMMSAVIVVVIPVIVLFIFTNKKLMGNITIGGIKG